jgi:hypothetical protein
MQAAGLCNGSAGQSKCSKCSENNLFFHFASPPLCVSRKIFSLHLQAEGQHCSST